MGQDSLYQEIRVFYRSKGDITSHQLNLFCVEHSLREMRETGTMSCSLQNKQVNGHLATGPRKHTAEEKESKTKVSLGEQQ